MKQQIWFCLACHTCGCVKFVAEADVYFVLKLIREDHCRYSGYMASNPLKPIGEPCLLEAQVLNTL